MTAACWATRRSAAGSRSRRAASSAWIVGGTLDLLGPAHHPGVAVAAQHAVVDEHAQHLAEEERVAVGRLEQPGGERRGQVGRAEQPVDQRAARVRGERRERDAALGQRGPDVAQLGPRERHDEHRRVAAPLGEVLDEVEERRLAPVHVVEHDDDRLLAREPLQEAPHRPERLLRRDRRRPRRAARPAPPRRAGPPRRAAASTPPAARTTSATGRNVAPSVAGSQCPRSTRASDSNARPSSATRRVFPTPGEPITVTTRVSPARTASSKAARSRAQLVVAARRAARAAAPPRRGSGVRGVDEPVGLQAPRLALQPQRLDRLQRRVVAHEAERLGPHEHLAVGRRLLEPRRHVQRVADQQVGRLRGVDDDLAGVHAGPHPDPDAPAPLEVLVQRGERAAHGLGRAHGAQRVVLAHHRRAPDGHHRVADELRDGALVRVHRAAHLLVEAVHHPAQRLLVEALAERREPDEVGEEDRQRLADLLPGRVGQRRAALVAELRARRVRLGAGRAGRLRGHVTSLAPSATLAQRHEPRARHLSYLLCVRRALLRLAISLGVRPRALAVPRSGDGSRTPQQHAPVRNQA